MSRNKIILLVFAFVALAQMAVPAMMILEREIVLNSGKEYKFRSAPRDPYDPFRGKYITMSYVSNETEVFSNEKWERGETVYVQFTEDEDGYAIIKSVSKSAPENTSDYLKTTVQYFNNYSDNGKATLSVYYPFDRFYMEESKAYDAEMAYNGAQEPWEDWDSEERILNSEEWKVYVDRTKEYYILLQDTTRNIWSYSDDLQQYKYAVEELTYYSELNFDNYMFSDIDQIQQIINEFDYSELVKEKIEEDELVEVPQSVAYSLVSIKNGRAVLKNVMIDDVGVKEVVESNYEEDYGH